MDEKIELYEHFFRDPTVGEGVLQPPRAGIACQNIRAALSYLGYSLSPGDTFDAELHQAVLQFQTDQGHGHVDGLIGPGTRRLITQAVLARSEGFFRRGRISPEYAVFLSYSRQDEHLVTSLVEGIRNCGIPIFRDKDAIPAGAHWPEMLYRSVRKCQVFLCLLSPRSAGSINVLMEVALARHAGKAILPVLLESTELPDPLHALMGNFQFLDLTDNHSSPAGLAEVLEALSHYGLRPRKME